MNLGLKELIPIINMAHRYLELVDPSELDDAQHEACTKYYNLILKILKDEYEPGI